ncbi:MAG TPA: NAD(P)-binding domain-containing protein [Actinophytocola sp.]|nr:NAD(P)-binding domain-containing protein [Actinophytocola sp.]
MRNTDTVVIGAGQAGLAASLFLTEHGRDHVVLERARVGGRWRDTWDSLHLLTPNWLNTLPGRAYRGPDPDGFTPAAAFAAELADYARSCGAPVEEHAGVERVSRRGITGGFEVVTARGTWLAANVVVATGWCDRPAVPATTGTTVCQVAPRGYRNPGSLPDGGVLIVDASATGVQLAEELRAAGRDVTLAVGGHSRLPRGYRGRDVYWWLDRLGVLGRTIDEMPDPVRARREPSAQLIGRPGHPLDLATLATGGVRLVGRVRGLDGHRVRLVPDLPATVGAAERRLRRLLARIDRHVDAAGLRGEVGEPAPVRAVPLPEPVEELDLRAAGVRSIVWATGFRRAYPWLRVPALDAHGEIRHRRGRTPVPGLYVLGQRFQHRRSSNLIGGVGRDAAYVAGHIAGHTAGHGAGHTRLPDPGATRAHP